MGSQKRSTKLTERQQRILAFIRTSIRKRGRPPTIREIGAEVGISSTSLVDYNLNALQKKGHLIRNRAVSRGIRLVEDLTSRGDLINVPVLGWIRAGHTTPRFDPVSVAECDDWVELTEDIVPRSDDLYALRVEGDSMIDALVNDGDVVIMSPHHDVRNGDMVAAWISDQEETTLKRFYLEGNQVRLQPANPTMEPMYFHPRNVTIQGKVVAVIRQLN